MRDLQIISETGAARGIDQSKNPARGSAYKTWNIWSGDGVWRSRPGIQYQNRASIGVGYVGGFAEYIPDTSQTGSHYHALLCVARKIDGGTWSSDQVYEIQNKKSLARDAGTITGRSASKKSVEYASTSGLMKYTSNRDGSTKYTNCTLFTNMSGVDPIFVYHQQNGLGEIEDLVSIDGGDSDITYLESPPRANFLRTFKDRLFAFQGNTIYHTTVDSSGVMCVNTWPASYNFEVGNNSKVLDAVDLGDRMIIFKKDEVWVLSGDGVDGVWSLDKVHSGAGVIKTGCAVEANKAVYFLGYSGLFRYSDGQIVNLSKDRLTDTLKDISFKDKVLRTHLVYDAALDIVVCSGFLGKSVSVGSLVDNGLLVYNIKSNSFDLWGLGDNYSTSEVVQNRPLGLMLSTKHWNKARSSLCFMDYVGSLLMMQKSFMVDDSTIPDGGQVAVHWWILTQKYLTENPESKLLRRFSVWSKSTGDWDLHVIPMNGDKSILQNIISETSGRWNIIESTILDGTPPATWNVNSQSNFTDIEDVDVYNLSSYSKSHDSKTTFISPYPEGIRISDFTRATSERSLVIPEDSFSQDFKINMSPDEGYMLGASNSKLGEMRCVHPGDFDIYKKGCNKIARNFRLFISNMSYYNRVAGDTYLARQPRGEIYGWELWVKPRGVRRV